MKNKPGSHKLTGRLFKQRITPEEEKELSEAIHSGDRKKAEKAFDRLVLSNIKLATVIAKEYLHSGVEFEDLISEAICGLMDGARNFLPDKGAKFSTYAVYWIRNRIQRFIPDGRRTLSIPLKHNYLKAKLELFRKEHGKTSVEEMAKALGNRPSLVKDIKRKLRIFPLTASFQDIPYEEKRFNDDGKELRQLLLSDFLTAIEKVVVTYRFGMNGNDPLSLNDIGERLGRTREGVRQVELEALSKLKKYMSID